MSSNATYQKFAGYYDAYVRGFREDLPLYHAMCDQAERILEIGCGTGRVLRSFLENGRSITGVDISEEMLAIAAAKLNPFLDNGMLRLINHNFVAATFPEKFQRVLITFYTFNYLIRENEALSFLSNVRRAMEKKALLSLDLFYPPVLSHPENHDQWIEKDFQTDGKEIKLRVQRILCGNMEERVQHYTEPNGANTEIITVRRYYSKVEMLRLLQEAGYKNILFAEGYRSDSFHPLASREETKAGFIVMAANETALQEVSDEI